MKKIKSYTNIWSIEKALYSLNDLSLPFPVTVSQITFFVIALFAVIFLGQFPPLSLIDNALIKYLAVPVGVAWFMSQKTFDGKRPYRFLYSAVLFLFRPKMTYAGRKITVKKISKIQAEVTVVRSEYHAATISS